MIKNLSEQLSDEFGTGFSEANLRDCRQFYLVFLEDSNGFSMAGKIPWSHLRSIMHISDEEERNFYLKDLSDNYEIYDFYGSCYLDELNTQWCGKQLIDRVDYY